MSTTRSIVLHDSETEPMILVISLLSKTDGLHHTKCKYNTAEKMIKSYDMAKMQCRRTLNCLAAPESGMTKTRRMTYEDAVNKISGYS